MKLFSKNNVEIANYYCRETSRLNFPSVSSAHCTDNCIWLFSRKNCRV